MQENERVMLTKLHIQNFKSLKEVTLDLQPVNLLIGPNNSGKTNLLKAVEFLGNYRLSEMSLDKFRQDCFKHEDVEIVVGAEAAEQSYVGKYKLDVSKDGLERWRYYNGQEEGDVRATPELREFLKTLDEIQLYRPNPLKFTEAEPIISSVTIQEDVANLIPFLETLRDEYRENFAQIEEDIRKCLPEFQDIRFKTVAPTTNSNDNRTFKKWGLFSEVSKMTYWAEELSEGVLYFVALLCIIHQPKPPKLLLLEEPERGIHPRRIKEVMDFIFNLSQSKGIQVIMTSHHPYVLNEFEDIPEAVFVFDKDEDGATQVRNLQKDIIAPSNEENDKQGLPRIKFTQDLAEHWFSGFLGGVPA
ncbi:MAG TPA: chromosome segregation protein SMC [Runella sp.]|nr:chromosome segregation protein SMC [Runella sp.]